ncbi:MAG: large conductance mechanosensitive channel protein MscL [Acidimicrobiia bacterium]|nr:large conductance mechanosensitive channel protein MscL [Acidimicrobiia bacterium]
MIQEFKDFVSKGSLVEIAVAFVMGVAFASVVSAFTTRIVTPLIGMIFNVSNLENTMTFGDVDPETGVAAGSVGAFLAATINFLIVALVMFMVIRSYNRMKAKMEEPAEEEAAGPSEVELLAEIRDQLARR